MLHRARGNHFNRFDIHHQLVALQPNAELPRGLEKLRYMFTRSAAGAAYVVYEV